MSQDRHDDDEQPQPPIATGQIEEGEAKLDYFHRKSVKTEEAELHVLIELTGEKPGETRRGVDIVAVLDVSGSMGWDEEGKKIDKQNNKDEPTKPSRLDKLKIAMKFLIQKLGPNDRLSIVTFASEAKKKCNLRLVTKDAQKTLEDVVMGLKTEGSTKIDLGLQKAVDVLKGRRYTEQRVPAIMLMSDGEPDKGSDTAALNVETDGVPVHTFGVTAGFASTVLNDIAMKSNGGTFSISNVVHPRVKTSDMSLAFAQCLAGLQSVAVQDLNLTIAPAKSEIQKGSFIEPKDLKVESGTLYKKVPNSAPGSVTISFGNLYAFEKRNILVKLKLPKVNKEMGQEVLDVSYTYSDAQGLLESSPVTLSIFRTMGFEDGEPDEVAVERTRLEIIDDVKRAKDEAERKAYEKAKKIIKQARDSLDENNIRKLADPKDVIQGLRNELDQLLELMDDYEMKGRHFINSMLTSHDRQRAAARGDMEKIRTFATKLMDNYIKQVNTFQNNPNSNLALIMQDLSDALGTAIGSIQKIEESLKTLSYIIQSP